MCLDVALHYALLYRQEMLHLLDTITIKKHFIAIAIKECSIIVSTKKCSIDIIIIKNTPLLTSLKAKTFVIKVHFINNGSKDKQESKN